jgi:hypothetical protein
MLGNAVLGVPYKACSNSASCPTENRPYGEPWVSVEAIKAIETYDDANRWTGGVTMNYNPTESFSNKFQVGIDQVNEEKIRYSPFDYPYVYIPAGEKALGYRNAKTITLDYLGTLKYSLLDNLSANLSFGAQGFWSNERRNMAVGRGYPAPGVSTVGGGTVKEASEWFVEEIQVGFYAQNRAAWNDKVFLTTGLRVDGNSAFGENYGLQTYPNVLRHDERVVHTEHGQPVPRAWRDRDGGQGAGRVRQVPDLLALRGAGGPGRGAAVDAG